MKIYETAVRKPISTILIFVGVIVFGLFSLNNLAVDQYPDFCRGCFCSGQGTFSTAL